MALENDIAGGIILSKLAWAAIGAAWQIFISLATKIYMRLRRMKYKRIRQTWKAFILLTIKSYKRGIKK